MGVIRVRNRWMMFGVLIWRRVHILGLNLNVHQNHHVFEYTIQQLYVWLGMLMAWWWYLVVVRLIRVLWMILGVWDVIEMGDGIGWELHTRMQVITLLKDISIQPYSWEHWCLSSEEDLIKLERPYRLRCMIRKHPIGSSFLQSRGLDILPGWPNNSYSYMEDSILILQTFLQRVFWRWIWVNDSLNIHNYWNSSLLRLVRSRSILRLTFSNLFLASSNHL